MEILNYLFEEWRNIDGFKNYMVSNYGRVKSIGRYINNRHNTKSHIKEKILKASNNKGYLVVTLYNNGVYKNMFLHRLVAMAFIPNPNNYPQVNHKSEDKTDNRVENLEWCDSQYNNNYGHRIAKASASKTNGKKSKIVVQYSLNGELINEFPSVREVQRKYGYNQSNISKCCRKNTSYNTAYGYIWKYKKDCQN